MTATLEITADDALRSIKRKSSDVFDDVEVHPAANLFPMMGEHEFAELKADIEKHGQREMIVYWRGQLLDGRNRLRACRELCIEPSECELDDTDDPVAYVLSANLHRRHLTTAQRAMVAVEVKKLLEPEAKERKAANLKKGKQKPEVENLPHRGKTRDQAAKLLKVSGRTVDKAEKILDHGSPELVAKVKAGEVSIDKAHKAVWTNKPRSRADKAVFQQRAQEWEILEELNDERDCVEMALSGFRISSEKILKDPNATSDQLAEVVRQAELRTAILAQSLKQLEALEAANDE